MDKRPDHRAVRSAHSYTIPAVVDVSGVSVGTARGWIRSSLPTTVVRRRSFVLDCEPRESVKSRRSMSKVPPQADELYCFTGKAGHNPLGLMVDSDDQSTKPAQLEGLCEVCGGTGNRMSSRGQLGHVRSIFDNAGKNRSRACDIVGHARALERMRHCNPSAAGHFNLQRVAP